MQCNLQRKRDTWFWLLQHFSYFAIVPFDKRSKMCLFCSCHSLHNQRYNLWTPMRFIAFCEYSYVLGQLGGNCACIQSNLPEIETLQGEHRLVHIDWKMHVLVVVEEALLLPCSSNSQITYYNLRASSWSHEIWAFTFTRKWCICISPSTLIECNLGW